MKFNEHLELTGEHAFLSASKYHWINYDEDKLAKTYENYRAAQLGTILHDFARRCIDLRQRLPRSAKTLNNYVNDAIGYRLNPEVVLYYSPNAFGTADAISFNKNFLRIHDLKTGVTPASMNQLYVYAALFCLEYDNDPLAIDGEFRIYQNDEVVFEYPDWHKVSAIMNKIVSFDRQINDMQQRMI